MNDIVNYMPSHPSICLSYAFNQHNADAIYLINGLKKILNKVPLFFSLSTSMAAE